MSLHIQQDVLLLHAQQVGSEIVLLGQGGCLLQTNISHTC